MITSVNNSKIKHVSALISSKKERMSVSSFVAEGTKMFLEADPSKITEVYISESFYERLFNVDKSKHTGAMLDVYNKLDKMQYEVVSDSVFKKMSDTVTPQGILIVVKVNVRILDDILTEYEGRPLKIIALEGLQDPGNMGTIVRTSEAAGFDFILAGLNTVDIYSAKVVRSTMGSVFRIPVVFTDDLYDAIDTIKSHGVMVYAAHLKGECSYRDVDYNDRLMILIGNEGRGLTDEASDKADTLVKIPMKGKVESLNASVAAAILMYETLR